MANKGTTVLLAALVFAAVGQAAAGAELILVDGSQLAGDSVERRGGEFVLATDDGGQVSIQVELVRAIRLTGRPPVLCEHWDAGYQRQELQLGTTEPEPDAEEHPASMTPDDGNGSLTKKPLSRNGKTGNEASTDVDTRDPHVIPPSSLSPTQSEQLAAFGRDPATFEQGPVDPAWHYDDVLGHETDVTQFRPSRWYRPPIDPVWRYEDELGTGTDVTQFNPSTWRRPPIPARWHPADGWTRHDNRPDAE